MVVCDQDPSYNIVLLRVYHAIVNRQSGIVCHIPQYSLMRRRTRAGQGPCWSGRGRRSNSYSVRRATSRGHGHRPPQRRHSTESFIKGCSIHKNGTVSEGRSHGLRKLFDNIPLTQPLVVHNGGCALLIDRGSDRHPLSFRYYLGAPRFRRVLFTSELHQDPLPRPSSLPSPSFRTSPRTSSSPSLPLPASLLNTRPDKCACNAWQYGTMHRPASPLPSPGLPAVLLPLSFSPLSDFSRFVTMILPVSILMCFDREAELLVCLAITGGGVFLNRTTRDGLGGV